MKFGLIGQSLKHSFSKDYFTAKFKKDGLQHSYENFEIREPSLLKEVLQEDVDGLNVTIPYKETIIQYLQGLHEDAQKIGAVNTLKRIDNGWVGYNTDVIGFSQSIKPFLTKNHTKALILGTGGASKAVIYALQKIGIETIRISRDAQLGDASYQDINGNMIQFCKLIINTTPLGMYPKIDQMPDIPYELLTKEHLLYDLIYNPDETPFLKKGRAIGAQTINGLSMLKLQAEASYKIWIS